MTNRSNPEWDRICHIIARYNYPSIAAFARELGLNRCENLYQIKRGHNGISRDLAVRICSRFPEIEMGWLLTGEGPMVRGEEEVSVLSQVKAIAYYARFPVVRPPQEPDKNLWFSTELVPDADFAVQCLTDELSPLYRPGSVLLLRRCAPEDPVIYGRAYFIITASFIALRIVRRGPRDTLRLESPDRRRFDPVTIHRGQVRELYLVE
ncbi:MAG: hypothetical protein LUF87_06120 [Alistipes sp.]|nr:hypothetical protein [Alistipes sp.]